MKTLSLRDSIKIMEIINESENYESFFEGTGNSVRFIIQEKFIIVK